MTDLDLAELTAASLQRIRERNPLIHNITNFVAMNDSANVLLALGASPVMAHATQEVREMVAYAGALVLNIGTLDDQWVESMVAAGHAANERGVPIVLDPVGTGATVYRTNVTERLLGWLQIAVVRGNAGELGAMAGAGGQVRGVDSVAAGNPDAATRTVARRIHGAAVASGPIDYISNGTHSVTVHNGHPLMGRITGSGCMAAAIVGAFLAVEQNPFLASVEATIAFGIAGEVAAERSAGPGTFRQQLIDAVASLDSDTIRARARATVLESQQA